MVEKSNSIVNFKFFYAYCILELLLLIVLKLVQSLLPLSNAKTFIMFSATTVNALFMAFLVYRVNKTGKDMQIWGLPLAAFVTLFADVFLVLAKDLARAGVITFISFDVAKMIGFFIFGLIQVVYAVYLGLNKSRIIIRISFYVIFTVVMFAVGILTLDRFIACLSMTQLILNLIYGWIEYGKKRTRATLIFAIGITLFLGGDAFIMLRTLLDSHSSFLPTVRFMVWVFYIPAQVVLTSSYLFNRIDAKA